VAGHSAIAGWVDEAVVADVVQELSPFDRVKDIGESSKQVWTTPCGTLTTSKKVKSQFTIPELHDNPIIEWDVHITKSLGAYDMIIGRDLLEFLGINVKFSDMTVEWGNASMPFKEYDSTAAELYHINDPVSVEEQTQHVTRRSLKLSTCQQT
jgi:hypothetical protein